MGPYLDHNAVGVFPSDLFCTFCNNIDRLVDVNRFCEGGYFTTLTDWLVSMSLWGWIF